MDWENLPTDYTDATFVGPRRYIEVDNNDGTVSFTDVTAYTNKEKSFFGANDANKMNSAMNEMCGAIDEIYSAMNEMYGTVTQIISVIQNVPSVRLSQVTLLSSAWRSQGNYYTQTVSLAGVETNERIDLQPTADILAQLMNDGVAALYVENENGTVTVNSVGGAPTVNLTMQITLTGIQSDTQ